MWLPYKEKCNQMHLLSARYMRHNVTPLNRENEPLAFVELIASWKQRWGVILHGQLQPHQTRSWDSFHAQLMVIKLV